MPQTGAYAARRTTKTANLRARTSDVTETVDGGIVEHVTDKRPLDSLPELCLPQPPEPPSHTKGACPLVKSYHTLKHENIALKVEFSHWEQMEGRRKWRLF